MLFYTLEQQSYGVPKIKAKTKLYRKKWGEWTRGIGTMTTRITGKVSCGTVPVNKEKTKRKHTVKVVLPYDEVFGATSSSVGGARFWISPNTLFSQHQFLANPTVFTHEIYP